MNTQLPALKVIENAAACFTLYLGGSRKMAAIAATANMWGLATPKITINEETDYDYYATANPALKELLLLNGFEEQLKDSELYPLDTEALYVLYLHNVQVIFRKDAEFYKTVFENIPVEVFVKYLWKSSNERTVKRENIKLLCNSYFAVAHAAMDARFNDTK